jgi:hypothetical protein
VPLASALGYLQGLLDELPMPGNAPNLSCLTTAPPPFKDPGPIPTFYLWLPDGRESRNGPAASMPRNGAFGGTGSGFKSTVHHLAGEFQWQNAGPDLLFYAMLDAIMARLRTADAPALVTDPYDVDLITQMADVGEEMSYRTAVRPVPDQQANQYQAVLEIPLTEVIQA